MSWSSDSQYICTRNDNMPTVLWIWEVHHLELAAILIQKDPIRAVAWDPKYPRLLLCTGSNHSYMWTPSGAYCINIPFPQFSVIDLKWNLDGSCLLLKDKELFCCAALPMLQESSDYSSDDWPFHYSSHYMIMWIFIDREVYIFCDCCSPNYYFSGCLVISCSLVWELALAPKTKTNILVWNWYFDCILMVKLHYIF